MLCAEDTPRGGVLLLLRAVSSRRCGGREVCEIGVCCLCGKGLGSGDPDDIPREVLSGGCVGCGGCGGSSVSWRKQ